MIGDADAGILNRYVDRHPAPDAEVHSGHVVAAMVAKRPTYRSLVADD